MLSSDIINQFAPHKRKVIEIDGDPAPDYYTDIYVDCVVWLVMFLLCTCVLYLVQNR